MSKVVPASELVIIDEIDHLETLRLCGGYYCCPKGPDGQRIGQLVAYAGRYDAGNGKMKQFVGDVYFNIAKFEEFPHVLSFEAGCLHDAILEKFGENAINVVMGAPMGGLALACHLAFSLDCRYVFPEKKVLEVASATGREKSKLVWGRHEIQPGDQVLLVEDLCNNFSTTEEMIKLVEAAGGTVVAIACILNRSDQTQYNGLSVISNIHVPTQQYKQDDPEVADDVAEGNVAWKPKEVWPSLMEVMAENLSN